MSLQPGARLGPYEIVAPLGSGGMGEVYRARDPRLGRDVAIKVLPERLSKDPDALNRFEREARTVAALSHPNILAIFDVGSDHHISYAVTELLEGETMGRRLGRGPLPWQQTVELGAAIADGLCAAHAKGIVHRDLKPDNIFLTEDGRVKVLDFGLARWTAPDVSSEVTTAIGATQPGALLGTVGYMSPEQVRGLAADASSDIFSLGCVIYEMVSGRRAFARETAAQTMTAILESHPPPMAASGHAVPEALEHLIRRCLAKSPAERVRSMGELALELKRLSRAITTLQPVRMSSNRRRKTLIAIAAAVAIVVAAPASVYWLYPANGRTEAIAILPFANDSGNPDVDYLSDGITESLINSLSQIPNLEVMSRNSVFRYKGRQTDPQAIGQTLNVQAVLTGRLIQRGDSLSISTELIDVRNNRHLWGEQYNRRLLDVLAVQTEISTEISDALRLKLTGEEKQRLSKRYTENIEAYQLYLRGRFHWNKKTPDGFLKGIEFFQKAIDADTKYAPAYAALAALYNNLANYNFALIPPSEAWTKAGTAAEKAIALDESLASAHTSLALVAYQWEWDWPKAEREFKRALALDPSSPSTYEPGPSSTYHWYSHYLMSVGRTEESLTMGRRALELDPLDLANNSHQGWHYIFIREYDRAIEPLQMTLEMDPQFSVARWYLGLAYEQQGAYSDAISQFENGVRLTGDRPSMLALLGHAYAAADRKSDAQSILQRLMTLSKEKYVPPYPIATIYAALGQTTDALTWLEKAYEERDSWLNYLGLDPRLDNLRSEPRFVALRKRLNLPERLKE